jgi:hypothetical protein
MDGKPAGMVDQPTTFEVKNDYAVIVGQAQVVKSVTTSWNATAAKVGAECGCSRRTRWVTATTTAEA